MDLDHSAVSLGAITLAGTAVAGVIWLAKYFANELSKDLKAHTKAAMQQVEASKQSAAASVKLEKTVREVGRKAELSAENSMQLLEFMQNLNGSFRKVVQQKVGEQRVEHQTVVHTDNKE